MKGTYDFDCNLAETLNLVGDKWTLLVLHRISKENNTFKELQESLSPIPTNILSDRIKLLEKNGFITPKLYSEHPPRYKYLLTKMGKEFEPVFNSMILWANKHLDKCEKTVKHEVCNEEVELKYYCKKCDDFVEDVIIE